MAHDRHVSGRAHHARVNRAWFGASMLGAALLLVAAGSGDGFAQTSIRSGSTDRIERLLSYLESRLDLDEEQTSEIRAVLGRREQESEGSQQGGVQELIEDLRAVLTQSQIRTLEKLRAELGRFARASFSDRYLHRLRAELALNDEQVVEIRPILNDYFSYLGRFQARARKGADVSLLKELQRRRRRLDRAITKVLDADQKQRFALLRESEDAELRKAIGRQRSER